MPPQWYKWVILLTTCISTFFAYGYISASTSIATVYYIQHYNERIISSIITSVNYGLLGIGCLPGLYLSKKIGNRAQQLIGGVLMSGAVAATSISTMSWQGLLLSGIVAGFGGGLMQIATTNTIKEYFPGRQIGPFGAVSLTLNSASIAVPQLWTSLMEILGWEKALLTIGAILAINILCGLTYVKPGKVPMTMVTQIVSRPKLTLIPRKSSSTHFTIPPDLLDNKGFSADENTESKVTSSSDTVSKRKDGDEKFSQAKPESNESEECEGQNGMWETLKQPQNINKYKLQIIKFYSYIYYILQSIAFIIMSGIYSGGIISCFTVMGDHAVRFLNMSDQQVANALTVQGALMIVSSLIYIFLTVCTEFCATLLHTVSMFALGAAALTMALTHTKVLFFLMVGTLGFFKSFTTGNSIPLAIELCGPEKAMNLYVLKMLVDGLCLIGMPFIAVYIQETIDEQAALYFSATALFCAGALFLPFIKRFLHKPRVKSASEVTSDRISTVKYNVYSYF